MYKIYKYQLAVEDSQKIEMPKDSRLLAVQTQGDTPCLWAIVDVGKEMVQRVIHTFGTGHEMIDFSILTAYVGTYQLHEGRFIGHIFDLGEV